MSINKEEMLIAQIANPYNLYPKERKIENIPSNFVISNEISLLLSEKGVEMGTAKEEKKKVECLMDELCKLKQVFDQNDIDYVVIKLPKLAKPLSDIDILVADNVKNAEFVLKQMEYILEDDVEPHRKTSVKTVNGERIAVDLHLELSWRRVKYLDKKEIWEYRSTRKVNGANVSVPCPEHELLISAAHTLFKHNEISLFDVLYANSIMKENDINTDFVEATAKRNGWYKQFLFFTRLMETIYKELYEERSSPNSRNLKRLPFVFPIHVVISLRMRKMFSDLRCFGVKRALVDLYAYSLDVVQYIFEERFSISLLTFFNALSFLKRRLRK